MAYNYPREQQIVFLRAIAQAADDGDLGVDLGKMMINGDLMREVAASYEQLLEAVQEANVRLDTLLQKVADIK